MYGVHSLGYERPNEDLATIVNEFLKGRDVFVSLPTGAGKLLCYACLPLTFDYLRGDYDPLLATFWMLSATKQTENCLRSYTLRHVLTFLRIF